MKHLIIGAGVIGSATGMFLSANKENVVFCDIKPETLLKLKNRGYTVTTEIDAVQADFYWICTAEWDTEEVVKKLSELHDDPQIIVRSTMPLGSTERLIKKYKLTHIAHMPEFLRQKTAIQDIFGEDRIIIGTHDETIQKALKNVFASVTCPILWTTPATSELIKYASNCWLATQISYWNQIKAVADKYKVNPQMVANGACLDHRISSYGSAMTGDPYGGFCFPKDMDALIKSFEDAALNPTLLKAVKKVNNAIIKSRKKKQKR